MILVWRLGWPYYSPDAAQGPASVYCFQKLARQLISQGIFVGGTVSSKNIEGFCLSVSRDLHDVYILSVYELLREF